MAVARPPTHLTPAVLAGPSFSGKGLRPEPTMPFRFLHCTANCEPPSVPHMSARPYAQPRPFSIQFLRPSIPVPFSQSVLPCPHDIARHAAPAHLNSSLSLCRPFCRCHQHTVCSPWAPISGPLPKSSKPMQTKPCTCHATFAPPPILPSLFLSVWTSNLLHPHVLCSRDAACHLSFQQNDIRLLHNSRWLATLE